MDKSVVNSDIKIYGYNSINRYDFFADDDFSVSQHMLVKGRDVNHVHTHSYYELEIILYGEVYEIVNEKKHKARPGDFVFLSPSDLHQIEFIDDEVIILCFKMKNEIFSTKVQKNLKCITFPIIEHMSEEEYHFVGECVENIEKIKTKIRKDELWRDIVMKMLEALVIYIIDRNDKNEDYSQLMSGKNDQMINAIIYVRENYDKDINMKSVSQKIGYSYNYFGIRFKEITGQTFINYLNDIRLNQAYNKLVASDESLESICKSVGFGNIPYFYRKFNEKYKRTPGEVRKEKSNTQTVALKFEGKEKNDK